MRKKLENQSAKPWTCEIMYNKIYLNNIINDQYYFKQKTIYINILDYLEYQILIVSFKRNYI